MYLSLRRTVERVCVLSDNTNPVDDTTCSFSTAQGTVGGPAVHTRFAHASGAAPGLLHQQVSDSQ